MIQGEYDYGDHVFIDINTLMIRATVRGKVVIDFLK